jgi:hypothetical protein
MIEARGFYPKLYGKLQSSNVFIGIGLLSAQPAVFTLLITIA